MWWFSILRCLWISDQVLLLLFLSNCNLYFFLFACCVSSTFWQFRHWNTGFQFIKKICFNPLFPVVFFFRITFCHLPFQSKWLYVGTERGNIHIVNVESFTLSGYVIMWNKAIELWVLSSIVCWGWWWWGKQMSKCPRCFKLQNWHSYPEQPPY